MLATDDNNPQFVGAKNPDDALIVKFYINPVQNNFESSKQGRPIFEDVIYVHIAVPGDKNNDWHMVARSDHKARFPRQWQHFENRTKGDAREIGTQVSEWPVLTRSQAEEFRAMKFFTVESIAGASDQNINALGMVGGMSPYILRDKARAFLAAATNTALPQHQAEELATAKAEIELLKEQMARLVAEKPEATAAPVPQIEKRGPGRPRKDQVAA